MCVFSDSISIILEFYILSLGLGWKENGAKYTYIEENQNSTYFTLWKNNIYFKNGSGRGEENLYSTMFKICFHLRGTKMLQLEYTVLFQLKGEMMMENNLTILEDQTCPTVGYQSASICVPVTVNPFAKTGATFTKCCGSPRNNARKSHLWRGKKRFLRFYHYPRYLCGCSGWIWCNCDGWGYLC